MRVAGVVSSCSAQSHPGPQPAVVPDAINRAFFNTAAFATAPQFVFGNASRNPVRGPAYRDLDVAVDMLMHLRELVDHRVSR